MTMRCAGSLPPEQSITNNRLGTPTCTAARPTPGAAYIVSNISLTSFFKSSSNLVTGSAGLSSTGFGHVTISNKAILKSFGRELIHCYGFDFTMKDRVSLVALTAVILPQLSDSP